MKYLVIMHLEGKSRAGKTLYHFNGNEVSGLSIWPKLKEKFNKFSDQGDESEFFEYLDSLIRVLEKDFPEKEEIDIYVPSGLGVKEKYSEILDFTEELPRGEISRNVLIKMTANSKFREYEKRTERVLEDLERLIGFLEGETALAGSILREVLA